MSRHLQMLLMIVCLGVAQSLFMAVWASYTPRPGMQLRFDHGALLLAGAMCCLAAGFFCAKATSEGARHG